MNAYALHPRQGGVLVEMIAYCLQGDRTVASEKEVCGDIVRAFPRKILRQRGAQHFWNWHDTVFVILGVGDFIGCTVHCFLGVGFVYSHTFAGNIRFRQRLHFSHATPRVKQEEEHGSPQHLVHNAYQLVKFLDLVKFQLALGFSPFGYGQRAERVRRVVSFSAPFEQPLTVRADFAHINRGKRIAGSGGVVAANNASCHAATSAFVIERMSRPRKYGVTCLEKSRTFSYCVLSFVCMRSNARYAARAFSKVIFSVWSKAGAAGAGGT